MLRVLTSNRAVSLQNVSMDIVRVATRLGVKASWYDRLVPSFELRKEGSDALVVMCADPLAATPWFLLVRDCRKGGVKAFFYATIEGPCNRRFIQKWMYEVELVANSNYTRDRLIEAGFTVVDVVPHGVDMEMVAKARSQKHLGLEYMGKHGLDPSKHVVVLTVANSHPRKGLAWLDKVVEEVGRRDASIKFLVVTEERGRNYFKPRSNLIVSTDFGRLPRLTVLSLIGSVHVLAVPSLSEGFGLPVLEAMALGTPVVHAELPPLMEFSTGFTVPVKEIAYFDRSEVGPSGIVYEQHIYDVKEFADVLMQVIDLYRNKRDAIADYKAKSFERALKYDIHVVYSRLLKIFGYEVAEIRAPADLKYDFSDVLPAPPPLPPPQAAAGTDEGEIIEEIKPSEEVPIEGAEEGEVGEQQP